MTAYVTTAAGRTFQLPVPLSWELNYTAGVPSDSFWVRCPWQAGQGTDPAEWVRFSAAEAGETVFSGVVDECEVNQGAEGLRLEVSGRGMAALLLDNEALGQDYGTATLEDILRDHVAPYGIPVLAGAALPKFRRKDNPKNPEEKPKTDAPTEKASTDSKGSTTQSKPQEKAVEVKPAPAVMPGPAALGPTGTKITKIFEDRLLPPDEHAMKDLPVPKDGESYFITLHPAYLEKSEFNTVSVDTNSDDYKELRKSIELNGVKDPVLTRINPKGGLEILSGQRRHMIARELNYPVPAIIQKIDDNDAMILVADSNLHRPHISTYDLSRTLRNKMTAMKRKAGRKKRGVPGADELQSDAMLAKEMGISTSKLNRIIRLSEATKAVCDAVDDNSLELSIASDLSFLSPEHQNAVIDLVGLNLKPTVKRVQRLRDAEKRGNLDDKTMRAILENKDIQPVKPPEPPKPAPAPATGTSPVTLAPPNMKPVMPEPPKQENTARPPATQTVEKPETAPTSVSNVIPISAESKQPGDSKAADDEPIEFNSPRENLYSLKVTLGGDRLRRYFPDVTMPALAITESIYSALEERRQREARMKQKTEILHPSKPIPTR